MFVSLNVKRLHEKERKLLLQWQLLWCILVFVVYKIIENIDRWDIAGCLSIHRDIDVA